ncbi:MAG: PLP-dependent cysteine synthase family protein [bacterium]
MPQPKAVRQIVERHPSLRLIGDTPLVRLDLFRDELPDVEVWAKVEYYNPGGSIKDRPVLRMLCEAMLDGRLREGKTILDSSSGNAGIAYAMIGRVLGFDVELVVPGNASIERKKRILAHGAKLTHTDPIEGYDEALREAHRLATAHPDRYFFCDQYANDGNWRAHYDGTAEEILAQTGGRVTHFVAGVGTGGTITGVGRRLKEHDPRFRVWSVRPEIFPGIEGLKPLGHPGDIVPKILDASVVDEWTDVSSEEARAPARALARHGLFVGQSSGGYLEGVRRAGREARRGVIVTILSDFGERYLSTPLWDIG